MKKLMAKFRCWFSNKYWDIHDYPDSNTYKEPLHFYEYTCERCGKKFNI